MSSQKEKATFSTVCNLAGNESLLYSNYKVLFSNKIYTRIENKWVLSPEDTNKFEIIGFVPYEEYIQEVDNLRKEINKLNEELKKVENKKNTPKYKSQDNYLQNEKRIRKVMEDIERMKQISPNIDLEKKIIDDIIWIEDDTKRKDQLKSLYVKSIKTSTSRTQVYSYYKRLSVLKQKYDENFPTDPSSSDYSQFYLDLKTAIKKGFSETTKFVTRIELFTKLFEYLPSGSWTVCNIPVTFYNLIYKEFWSDIFRCIEKNEKFPYNKHFNEDVLASMFDDLNLEEEGEIIEVNSDQGEEDEIVEVNSDQDE